MSEEAQDSMSERMAEAQHSSGKALGNQSLKNLNENRQASGTMGNIIDKRV